MPRHARKGQYRDMIGNRDIQRFVWSAHSTPRMLTAQPVG